MTVSFSTGYARTCLIFEGNGKTQWFQGNFATYEEKVQAENPDRLTHRRNKYKQIKLKR